MLADLRPAGADAATDTAYAPCVDDDGIARAARRALRREHIEADDRFVIRVERGWLTLEGRAAHRVERSAAGCVVRYVPGVTGVTNRLTIVPADR